MKKLIPEIVEVYCDVCESKLEQDEVNRELAVTITGSNYDLSGPTYGEGCYDVCIPCMVTVMSVIKGDIV